MRALIISRSRWFRLALPVVVALGSAALAWGIVWWTGGDGLEARVVSAAPRGEEVGRLTPVAIRIEGDADRKLLRDSLTISPDVPGSIDWKDDALVFQPQWPGYARGATYSVELPARAGLKEPLSFSFVVEGKLAVSMVVPAPDTAEVPLDGALLVQFNRPVAPMTVLEEAPQKDVLRLEPTVDGSGKWLTSTTYIFRPATTWAPATSYVATVPAGVSDTLGVHSGGGLHVALHHHLPRRQRDGAGPEHSLRGAEPGSEGGLQPGHGPRIGGGTLLAGRWRRRARSWAEPSPGPTTAPSSSGPPSPSS